MKINFMIMINIGCGQTHHPDWINLDLFVADNVRYYNAKNQLPLAANSADVIYHSHLLEHLTKEQGEKFLRDCYRVLKPGGRIRIAVPDLETISAEYLKNLRAAWESDDRDTIFNYEWNKLEMFDQMIRKKHYGDTLTAALDNPRHAAYLKQRVGTESLPSAALPSQELPKKIARALKKIGLFLTKRQVKKLYDYGANCLRSLTVDSAGERHHWMYDRLDLKILLTRIGFRNFAVKQYNESDIRDWEKYKLDLNQAGDGPRKPDSLFVEAEK